MVFFFQRSLRERKCKNARMPSLVQSSNTTTGVRRELERIRSCMQVARPSRPSTGYCSIGIATVVIPGNITTQVYLATPRPRIIRIIQKMHIIPFILLQICKCTSPTSLIIRNIYVHLRRKHYLKFAASDKYRYYNTTSR